MQDVACTDSRLTGNGENGLRIETPATGLVITGCDVTGNGQDTGQPAAGRAGVALLGRLQKATIRDNDCRSGAGQPLGVYLAHQDGSLAATLTSANTLSTTDASRGVVIGDS